MPVIRLTFERHPIDHPDLYIHCKWNHFLSSNALSHWRSCCYLGQTSVQKEAAHQSLLSNALFYSKLSIWRCYQIRHWSRSSSLSSLIPPCVQSVPELEQQLVFLNSCLHSAVRAGTKPEWMLFISADHCLRVHVPKAYLRCLPRGEAILAITPLPLVSNGGWGHGLIWMGRAECQVML